MPDAVAGGPGARSPIHGDCCPTVCRDEYYGNPAASSGPAGLRVRSDEPASARGAAGRRRAFPSGTSMTRQGHDGVRWHGIVGPAGGRAGRRPDRVPVESSATISAWTPGKSAPPERRSVGSTQASRIHELHWAQALQVRRAERIDHGEAPGSAILPADLGQGTRFGFARSAQPRPKGNRER